MSSGMLISILPPGRTMVLTRTSVAIATSNLFLCIASCRRVPCTPYHISPAMPTACLIYWQTNHVHFSGVYVFYAPFHDTLGTIQRNVADCSGQVYYLQHRWYGVVMLQNVV